MEKNQKTNIVMMGALIVLFIIGIIVRWDYIVKELTETFEIMFNR